MKVSVRLFARAKDLAGVEFLSIDLPEAATVAALRCALSACHPVLAGLLARSAIAVGEEFAGDEQPLAAGAVVAVLPPVSGGSGT